MATNREDRRIQPIIQSQQPQRTPSSRNKIPEPNVTQAQAEGNFLNKLFKYLFYTHISLIAILAIALILRGLLSSATHHFSFKKWFLPILSSTACAGITGFAWQAFTTYSTTRTVKTTFWLSPLLTLAYGVLLVYISTPWSLAASAIAILSFILQSLYACWVNQRFDHATKILTLSLTYNPPKLKATVFLSIITTTLYSSFLMTGIGGATSTGRKIDTLFIFIILGSFTWTMQIIKNIMQVTVSHTKYMKFACGVEVDFKTTLTSAVRYSTGTICIASIVVPVLHVIQGLTRGLSLLSGGADEFMISGKCCSGVASRVVLYGNRWGFVHVGLYNKGIMKASIDTWGMFRTAGMESMIDFDLTSSFCFLCAGAAGSICGLVGGIWELVIDKRYATTVSIYAFLTGYFINAVAMAWVQASVTAYYVAYAENPESQQFDNTIPDYIKKLKRSEELQSL